MLLRYFSTVCSNSKAKQEPIIHGLLTQKNYPSGSQQTQITKWSTHTSNEIRVTSPRLEKLRAAKTHCQLILVLLFIGWESGTSLLKPATKRRKEKRKPITQITFDSQLTPLLFCHLRGGGAGAYHVGFWGGNVSCHAIRLLGPIETK